MTDIAAGQRIVLVTGASRGIGAAVAGAFAAAGDHICLAARDRSALERVADHIRTAGGAATVHPLDVTDEAGVHNLLEDIEGHYGRLDAAVNNAGGSGRRPAPLQDWTASEFASTIAVNLTGTFLCLKYELALMAGHGGGAIVNVSSTAGQQGVAGLAGYVAGKYGVEGLTRVAALDNAAANIRVNAIAPGPILTNRLLAAGPNAQAAIATAVPVGRLGNPDDISTAALWLCSPHSRYITGTTLVIDGGRLAGPPPQRSG